MSIKVPSRSPQRKADEAVAERMLREFTLLRATMTEQVALLRSQVVNNVLASELLQLDADGQAVREFGVPVGSVAVSNHSTADVVVGAGTPTSNVAPQVGRGGMHRVSAGCAETVNLTGHVVTLYGTPGAIVSLQVFTKPQPPAWGTAGPSSWLTSSVQSVPARPGVPLDVTASAAAGAAASADLAAAAARTTWLTGFELTWDATGTGTVNEVLTVTGPASPLTYRLATVAGAGGQLVVELASPIPAAAVNTPISVSVPATLNRAAVAITAHGFRA